MALVHFYTTQSISSLVSTLVDDDRESQNLISNYTSKRSKFKLTNNSRMLIIFHTVYHNYVKVINCEKTLPYYTKTGTDFLKKFDVCKTCFRLSCKISWDRSLLNAKLTTNFV